MFRFWRLRQRIPHRLDSEAIEPISRLWSISIAIVLAPVFQGDSAVEAQNLDHRCMQSIETCKGFELHVPLNDRGEPAEKEIYSTGGLDFQNQRPQVRGRPGFDLPQFARDRTVDPRKTLSSDPAH